MNLDELNINNDGVMEVEEESYPTSQMAPPPEGSYTLRLVDVDIDKDQAGQPKYSKTDDGKQYPILLVKQVEIVEGQYAGRKIYPFQRVYSKPFLRDTATGKQAASGLGDMIRAFGKFTYKGIARQAEPGVPCALELVKQFHETGTTFTGRLRWTAYDKAKAEEVRGNGGDFKAIQAAAVIKGMKNFPLMSNGGHVPEVVGPSGDVLTARVEISTFVPSKD